MSVRQEAPKPLDVSLRVVARDGKTVDVFLENRLGVRFPGRGVERTHLGKVPREALVRQVMGCLCALDYRDGAGLRPVLGELAHYLSGQERWRDALQRFFWRGCSRQEAEALLFCWAAFGRERQGSTLLALGCDGLEYMVSRWGSLWHADALATITGQGRLPDVPGAPAVVAGLGHELLKQLNRWAVTAMPDNSRSVEELYRLLKGRGPAVLRWLRALEWPPARRILRAIDRVARRRPVSGNPMVGMLNTPLRKVRAEVYRERAWEYWPAHRRTPLWKQRYRKARQALRKDCPWLVEHCLLGEGGWTGDRRALRYRAFAFMDQVSDFVDACAREGVYEALWVFDLRLPFGAFQPISAWDWAGERFFARPFPARDSVVEAVPESCRVSPEWVAGSK